MGRRRKHHRQGPQPKRRMLDMARASKFKYQVKATLRASELDDDYVNPICTTMFSKASRNDIDAAKEWLDNKYEEGLFDDELREELHHLLERFSMWR